MKRIIRAAIAAAIATSFTVSLQAAEPELVSVAKIWDAGQHNAFTDLVRFKDAWYCTFRESAGHVGGDGKLRVITSTDGAKWESAALVAEEGIDLRDPKLSITPDGRLMMVAGGSVYRGTKTLQGRQPRVVFSKDGREWTTPQRVLGEGEWLWRVTWHDGKAYGTSYNIDPMPSAAGVKPPLDWNLKLFISDDGVSYKLITPLEIPGHPNETTLRVLSTGHMVALVRREGSADQNNLAWIGVSKPPFDKWKFTETKYRFGGPNFIETPDGSLWAAGRRYDLPGGAKTILAKMDRMSLTPALTLPSGGDTSYAGLVFHEGLLWMSYYSTHEGKTSIYLAKIKLP